MKKIAYSELTAKGLSLALAGGAVLTISFVANAQSGPPPGDRGPGHIVERADSNGDGNVSLEEFQAFHAKIGEEHFARMDSNNDGVVNSEDTFPGPRGDGEFGRRGDDGPRGEGRAGRRGDGPRDEGKAGRRGDGPRGEFGHRGDGPRGEGKAGRRGDGPRGHGMFLEKADTNGDGGVSLEELQAVRPDATPEHFAERDTNGDGVLNRADHPEGGPGRRGPRPPRDN